MSLVGTLAFSPLLAQGFDSLVPLLIVLFFVISVVRALKQAQRAKEQHDASGDEAAAERRAEEIRERLRRIAAERRGAEAPQPPTLRDAPPRPIPAPVAPTMRPPERVPPLDPFRGPVGRMLAELERKLAQPPVPPMPQPRIPEMRRVDVEARELRPVRPEPLAFEGEGPAPKLVKAPTIPRPVYGNSEMETKRRIETRRRLIGDLREPESLRRAFLLREVLGPPVGMRR